MSHGLFHKITAISMAFLIQLSSAGLTVDLHYCQNQIKSISLYGKAKSCHEKQAPPFCHKENNTYNHKKEKVIQPNSDNCCHNETVVIEKSDIDATKIRLATIQGFSLDFLTPFVSSFVIKQDLRVDFQSYPRYKPPLPDRDVQVLYQTFLI